MTMEFAKYLKDGAYHWDATSASLAKHVAFTSARYQAVLNQPIRWKDSLVLDIACGDARLTAYVAEAEARFVVGVDLSRIGMTVGRERWARELPQSLARSGFVQADGLVIPVATETFDIVIASEIIEHVEDPRAFLREAIRPLKAGGTLIVTTPYRLTEKPLDPYHVREYFPGELEALLKEVFADVTITLSHPTWVTSLYTTTGGWARPFRTLVNAFSIVGSNPFVTWPLRNYASQITVYGKEKIA
jgi:ubiquinone/menaquinone biosynthesis C-methylase UbiE